MKEVKRKYCECGDRARFPYEEKDPLAKPIDMNASNQWALCALKEFSERVIDARSGRAVLHIRDFPTFIRAIGKVKYLRSEECVTNNKKNGDYALFLRGQTYLGKEFLTPAYYRRESNLPSIKKSTEDAKIEKIIDAISLEIQKNRLGEQRREFPRPVVEGLLQHYGAGSRWIDVVDNIWTALWFACHNAWRDNRGTVHYELRSPIKERCANRYCYVLLLGTDMSKMKTNGISGFRGDKKHEILDLRYALPSNYLRPHLQHGMLIRTIGKDGQPVRQMEDLVQSIIRIDLENALKWLGEGISVDTQTMFPPPVFDSGYDTLLRAESRIIDRMGKLKVPGELPKMIFPVYM